VTLVTFPCFFEILGFVTKTKNKKNRVEGMVTLEKRKKTKIIPGTQPKARAGWPKRLRLVQAIP